MEIVIRAAAELPDDRPTAARRVPAETCTPPRTLEGPSETTTGLSHI